MKSEEGTTQDDFTATAVGISPLPAWLSEKSKEKPKITPSKQIVFADELNGVSTLENDGN